MREQHWYDLARRLGEACAVRDWPAIGRLDQALAHSLDGVAGAGLDAGERRALQALRQAHEQARQGCARELQRVSQNLARLEASRERWGAYAASAGWQWESA